MGGIADSMINGEFCAMCGSYLEPNEVVMPQHGGEAVQMPADGSGYGIPVLCLDCYHDED
jgi:hypothetical protein